MWVVNEVKNELTFTRKKMSLFNESRPERVQMRSLE